MKKLGNKAKYFRAWGVAINPISIARGAKRAKAQGNRKPVMARVTEAA